MQWTEVTKGLAPGIARAWMAMHDERTAIASAFEMTDGKCKVVYSLLGRKEPVVEENIPSARDAMRLAEAIVTTQMVVPRILILHS